MSEYYINIGGLISLVILGVLALFLNKRYLFIPIILTACYLTNGQTLVLGGFHFYTLRIVLLLCWLRILFRGEFKFPVTNNIDKYVIMWAISSVIINMILWQDFNSYKEKLGFFYDVILLYGLYRISITNYSDIELILKSLAIIIIPVAILMLYESRTGYNIFSYFGGVQAMSEIREGRIRAQGPFRHSILAGTFGATSIPLFVALYASQKANRIKAVIAIVCCLVIVITARSSGPLMVFFLSSIAFMFWHFRDRMKMVRWGILISLILLHIIMKAPVWYLFSRLGDIIGGGGWHRSYLINQAITHIGEWWLIGTKTTQNWMPYSLAIQPNSADMTNQFIAIGVNGGIITMILFVFIIIKCFQGVGNAQKLDLSEPLGKRFCLWAIGVSLFAHVVGFFSISYFDQMIVFWYILIAIIAAIVNMNNIIKENNKQLNAVNYS